MKIIYVNVEDRYFLTQRLNLALAAKAAGLDVVIASNKSELFSQIEGYGFRYIDTRLARGGKNPFDQVCAILRMVKIFKDEKPDIVHNISIKPVIYGSIAAKLSGVPKVINLINGLGYSFVESSSLMRKIIKEFIVMLYRFALMGKRIRVIFQNPDDRDYFLKRGIVSKKNSFVILGSGVDTEYFRPLTCESSNTVPVVLFFARMLWDKGVAYLIDAALRLKKEGVNFRLIFVGEPDLSNPSHVSLEILNSWHDSNLIEYLGYRPDILGILRNSDIVVLPTYYREGVPLSLIESASVGKPIITTDMPGCREIVLDGVNGFLVPPKDSNILSEKLSTLIEDIELRNQYGTESRKRAKTFFSSEVVNKSTLEIYFCNDQ